MKRFKDFFTNQGLARTRHIVIYLILVGMVSVVLFWRYPNNVVFANFYGEDGSVYLQNIMDKGWLKASVTPFNGYAIIGLYIVCGFGWIINAVFLGGTFFTLAAAFALAAIICMAAIIALPYLLFKNSLGKLKTLIAVLFGALLPLPISPHVVIGTIGNQKWIFLYLAFLLVIYRVIHHKQLSVKRLILLDALLFISAYTNSTVYFLIPLLTTPYLQDYLKRSKKQKLIMFCKEQLQQRQTRSLLILGMLLIPQIIYVLLNGIPKLAGYLDTPFNPSRAIELFINRTYLFGITHMVNGQLNNILVLILFGLLMFVGIKMLKKQERFIFLAGIYTAGVASLLFTINRPGVTDHFFAYRTSGSGPDQFFYAQTLVMYLPIILATLAFTRIFKNKAIQTVFVSVFVGGITLAGLLSNSIYGALWRNASVFENDAGIFTDQAIFACAASTDPQTKVTVYPYKSGQFSIYTPREQLCNNTLIHYQPSAIDLGLKVNNNDHMPITTDGQFTQTFVASENKLNGLRLFISNFGKSDRKGEYRVRLFDSTCSSLLRETTLPTRLIDNTYANIRFTPITDSATKTYCFSISPPEGGYDKIALQRSAPGVYSEGVYSEKTNKLEVDLVFGLLYDREK